MIEAMRRAYADRARHLGDPDFAQIPDHLTTKEYAKKLAAGIDPTKATPSATLAPEIALDEEGDSTTHFSVIDKDGMAVSNTYTLENSYGNRVVVRGAGYLLNNEMTDFNPRPGVTTAKRADRHEAEPDRAGQADAQFDDADDRAEGRQAGAGHRQPRRADDHQHRAVRRGERGRLRHAGPGGGGRPAAAPPVVPGRGAVRGREAAPGTGGEAEGDGPHGRRRHRQGDAHTIWIDPKTGVRVGAADKRLDGKAVGE